MLKMGGRGDVAGKPVQIMVIGLSHMNLDRLRAGQPIKCKGSDFGLSSSVPIEVIIFAGESEQQMAREFAELVSIDPRLRD